MKPFFLYVLFVFLTTNIFSQIPQKKEMQKAKPNTLLKASIVDTALSNKNIIKTSPVNRTPVANMVAPKSNSNLKMPPKKENIASNGESNMQPGKAMASLFDMFITIKNGLGSAGGILLTSGNNKDNDTHWSCGVFYFDQNGNEKQVTDFHDNSDNDEYEGGSLVGPLKMNMDNRPLFSQLGNGGHVHINIAPNGNDTWGITQFTLTLDFVNPKLSQVINWQDITLSQDHRDADLYFIYDGQNFVVRK
jgi:hypothetical protein